MRVVDQTKETVKLMSVQEIQRAFIRNEQSEELQRAKDVGRGGGGCQRLRLGDSIIGSASAAAYVNTQMQMANNKCVQHVHNS